MRRHLVVLVVALGFLAARSARPSDPLAAEPLWKAYKEGRVAVAGRSLGSYSQARLAITNRTKEKLTVDVNASYLHPSSSAQRLGMGLLEKGSPRTEVDVEAGRTVTVNVLSVCMDFTKPCPSECTSFVLAKEEAPAAAAKALKRWKSSPRLPQEAVQYETWGIEWAPPRKRPRAAVPIAVDLPEPTRKVVAATGAFYALLGPGELAEGVPNGELRPLASEVEDVLVQEDGLHALFRSPPAAVSSGTQERRACVARWDGKQFQEEVTVPKRGALLWAMSGGALLRVERELVLVRGTPGDPRSRVSVVGAATDAVARDGAGVALLSADGMHIRRIGPGEGPMLMIDVEVPLASLARGADGLLYATSRKGSLFRVSPRGALARLDHLLDDGTRARRGETVSARSVLRIDEGLAVDTGAEWLLLRADGTRDRFVAPSEGSELIRDEAYRCFARAGITLSARAGARWDPVHFIVMRMPALDPEDVATVGSDAR